MVMCKVTARVIMGVLLLSVAAAGQRRQTSSVRAVPTSVVINSEATAIVWIDEIRRGTTDASGRLELKVSYGRHVVRVRANGFREVTVPLLPGKRTLSVKLVETKDQAELLFQQAEEARDKARDDAAKEQAADL